ncbi:MAG TPA: sulfotransferase domain-containing protein [Bacteroidia bacterium]|nr:sulfotransferase domain-containing protein [Bacteroidia bacterium]
MISLFGRKNKKEAFPLDNIFHCCAHKTGSQWVRAFMSDPLIRQKTGLEVHTYMKSMPEGVDSRKVDERFFDQPFPLKKIVSPLYLSRQGYESIPKPESFASFYIYRNPRDILISYYFSVRETHAPNEKLSKARSELQQLGAEEGLIYAIDSMNEQGYFRALSSWFEKPVTADEGSGKMKKFRFEDLTDFSTGLIAELFLHCSIRLSKNELASIESAYSFASMQKKDGRKEKGHYRSGVHGEWKKYFTERVTEKFTAVTGDLYSRMGYEESDKR